MNDTFLKACRGEDVPYTPVWLMRQAGRYMKEYQRIRGKVDFLTLCKTPHLAVEVTLQPVTRLGVDAAILFSDILIPVEAMGMELRFYEKKGPVFKRPIRDIEAVKRLRVIEAEQDVPFVMETIRLLRKELDVPLIGFSGAPFTLATYMIEGTTSRDFLLTKRMIFQERGIYTSLMDKITGTVMAYLTAQVKAGAQALQLFDTWAGVLSPHDFREFALPYVKRVIEGIRAEVGKVPIIYFVGQCAGLLEEIRKAGADVIGIDWRLNIDDAIRRLGNESSVQGNLDPSALFLPKDDLKERVVDILRRASIARGYIFNLGHGILPQTPVENVVNLVKMVHEISIKG